MSTATIARTPSASSTTSEADSAPQIPFTRRRLTPDQIQVLQTLYELKSHPSKEERADLARELNMEMKAVNVWFQNKRRSMKKKSIAWNRATALMSENAFGMGHRYLSTPANPSRQKSQLRRNSSFSLDSIAASREVKDLLSLARPPLTPRKNSSSRSFAGFHRAQGMSSADGSARLWDHLLSSPPLPPSSPSKENDLLSTLPPRAKTLKSLEWACAKDRVGRKKKCTKKRKVPEIEEGESHDVPDLVLDTLPENDTEADEDELITPDTSMTMSVIETHTNIINLKIKSKEAADPPAEDVEAAMALLGFKVTNS